MYAAARSRFGGDSRPSDMAAELFTFEVLILAVLAPMFVGASIAEEIEERTTTYLWSRPLPRWSVLAGKLLALVPVTAVIVLASWSLSTWLSWSALPPARTFAAIGGGAIAMSLVATGIATLAPKHGMALTIVYMLFFDFPIGVLPATFQELSIGHHVRVLSGMRAPFDNGTWVSAAIGLVVVGGLWGLIGALRVRRLEA
jgi:ABC-type transport system involved in multi-copper enzyme maturation permease subunit